MHLGSSVEFDFYFGLYFEGLDVVSQSFFECSRGVTDVLFDRFVSIAYSCLVNDVSGKALALDFC